MALSQVIASRSRGFGIGVGIGSIMLGLVLGSAHLLDLQPAEAEINTITLRGRDALGKGLQDVYRLQLSDPAPPAGLQVTLQSNTGACVLAASENSLGDGLPLVVTIPYNQRRARFVVQSAANPSATCTVSVTGTSPAGWTGNPLSVSMVPGKLHIRALPGHIGPLAANEPFYVETGAPAANGAGFRVQGRSKQLADLPITVCSNRPDLGTIDNVFGQDPPPVGCEENPVVAPFSRTVPGDFKFDPIMGDDAGDIHVTATAPGGFAGDERIVNVRALSVTGRGRHQLGIGLQEGYTATLSDRAPSDLTVTVAVTPPDDAQYCVVAETEESLGRQSITRTISSGRYRAEFLVQGVAATPEGHPCVVTVSAGQFGLDRIEIDVKQPGLRLRELASSIGELARNDEFFVEAGVPDDSLRTLRFVQGVRKGTDPTPNTPVTVTVASDNKAVGTIVDVQNVDTNDDGMESDDILLTFSRTVPGNLKFDPKTNSATPVNVTATAPGFNTDVDSAAKAVLVQAAGLQITGVDEIGSYLQDTYRVDLQKASGHADLVVRITSTTPQYCKVAATENGDGSNYVDRPVATGENHADFVVHAAEMVQDQDAECILLATTPNFDDGHATIKIVEPGIQIRQLARNLDLRDDNDPFFVEVGVPNSNDTALKRTQELRKGSTVPFKVCAVNPTAGVIVDEINTDNPPSPDDPAGQSCEDDVILSAFANNVPGDLKFDPRNIDSTLVTVTAVGFRTMIRTGNVEVKVGGDSIRLNPPPAVGTGLQDVASVALSKPAGTGGVTLTIISDTSDKCVVSNSESTPGTVSTLLMIPEGAKSALFSVSGLLPGTCMLRATAPAPFETAYADLEVEECGFEISGLPRTMGTTDPPTDFVVQVGVPGGRGHLRFVQPVKAGGPAKQVTVCSTNTAVGEIDLADPSGCRTLTFAALESEVTFRFKVKGVVGDTTVTADGSCGSDDQRVHVRQTVVRPQGGVNVLGTNLQATYYAVANTTGGLSFNVQTLETATCVVSTDPTVPGDGLPKPLTIPPGSSRAAFVVQALSVPGTCTIQIYGSSIPTSERTVRVDYSRLRIQDLEETTSVLAKGDLFSVEIGPRNPRIPDVISNRDNRSGILYPLPRRAGAPALNVQVCSTDYSVGIVHDPLHSLVVLPPAGNPQCVASTIVALASETLEFEFHPQGVGSTDVTAAAPNDSTVDDTRETVIVKPETISISGPERIGKGLQEDYDVVLSKAASAAATATLQSLTPAICLVAAADDVLGGTYANAPILKNRTRGQFWAQALDDGECIIHPTIDLPNYTPVDEHITVRAPSAKIVNLDTSLSTQSPNEPFNADIGVRHPLRELLQYTQAARIGGGGVPLYACSSNPAVADIVGSVAGCKWVTVPEGERRTAEGDLVLDPQTAGSTTVCVYGPGFERIDPDCKDVKVAAVALNILGPDKLGSYLQEEYTLATSAPMAQDTIFEIDVAEESKGLCKVALTASSDGQDSILLQILAKKSRATFDVQGLDNVTGLCALILKPPIGRTDIAEGRGEIDVVQPGLQIVGLDTSVSSLSPNDDFNVQVGVPSSSERSVANAQARRHGGARIRIRVCSSRQLVGEIVGDDADGCTDVYIDAEQDTSANGAVSFDPHGQDPATDTTTVTATAPSFLSTDAASKDVTVATVVLRTSGPAKLGASLEDGYSLLASDQMDANTPFTIESITTDLCLVSEKETDNAVSLIPVTIPKGRSRVDFYVHALEAVTGNCQLSLRATPPKPGITDGVGEIDIVVPGLRIVNLASSIKTGAADDGFNVELGVPTTGLRSLSPVQKRRTNAADLTVTVCSSDTGIATVVGTATSEARCKSALVSHNTSRTVDGALALHPVNPGPVTIRATAPGFIPISTASKDVEVASGTLNLSGPAAVGAGLEDTFTLAVNPKVLPDAGVHVELRSLDPTRCLVAPDEATLGAETYTPLLAKGTSSLRFAVQGKESTTGLCRIRVKQTDPNPTYAGDELEVDIKQPGVRIRSLDPTTTKFADNDPFYIDVGVPYDNLKDLRTQNVRAGVSALVVKACSSDTDVGVILGTATTEANCKSATIAAGSSGTLSNALKFDPVWQGTTSDGFTTVKASADGYIRTDAGSVDVVVAGAALSIVETNIDRVGSGLMDTFTVKASEAVPSPTDVTVTSLTPNVCQVAADEGSGSLPAGSVIVTINSGRTKNFAIHGKENQTGTCSLQAQAAGFADGFADFDIVQPALRIYGLPTSKASTAADDPFEVDVGVPRSGQTNLQVTQKVRAGSSPLTATVCSSQTSIGWIVRLNVADACRTATIPVGDYRTQADATNTLKFRVAGANGQTVVDASIPNFLVTTAGIVRVSVSGFGLDVKNDNTTAVGAGLQQGTFYVARDGSSTNQVTVRVTASPSNLCLVSLSGTAVGTSYIDLPIAAGAATSAFFWVQGLDGALGACQLVATADGYDAGSGATDIVKPGIQVTHFTPTSMDRNAGNVMFNVEIGLPAPDQSALSQTQQVRAGGGFDITVANSNSAAGQLVGSDAANQQVSGPTITVRINPGQFTNTTGALQRLDFDPNNALTVTTGTAVNASNASVIPTTAATVNVTVTVSNGC